jgi:peroxiredoxin
MPAEIEDFSLPASTGQTLSLGSFKGKVPLVLVFVDLDDEDDRALLADLNARHRDFGSERSQVLAVAKVTARDAREIAEHMDLSVPVLADASGAMARGYDAEGRVAIVADKEGHLVRRFDPLPTEGDPSDMVDALLYAIRALGSGAIGSEGES